MKYRCLSGTELIVPQVNLASGFWSRLRGLLGRPELDPGEAMLFEPCNSVHTLGMAFPIGVIFLSEDNHILHVLEEMLPNRLSPIVKGSKRVLEMHPETLAQHALIKGMKLDFEAVRHAQ